MGVLTSEHLRQFNISCPEDAKGFFEITAYQYLESCNAKGRLFPLVTYEGRVIGNIKEIHSDHVVVDLSFFGRALEDNGSLENTAIKFVIADTGEPVAFLISVKER